jgi:hypothetical protein
MASIVSMLVLHTEYLRVITERWISERPGEEAIESWTSVHHCSLSQASIGPMLMLFSKSNGMQKWRLQVSTRCESDSN